MAENDHRKGWRGDSEGHRAAALQRKQSKEKRGMSKVWYDAKSKEYKHENGRSILASELRTLPRHRRAILEMAGVDATEKPNAPIPNETQIELKYAETILGGE